MKLLTKRRIRRAQIPNQLRKKALKRNLVKNLTRIPIRKKALIRPLIRKTDLLQSPVKRTILLLNLVTKVLPLMTQAKKEALPLSPVKEAVHIQNLAILADKFHSL